MNKAEGIFNTLELNKYTDEELEILGKRFSVIFNKHIAMIKYHSIKLKIFDFTVNELTDLSNLVVVLIEGVGNGRTSIEYRLKIVEYLNVVDSINQDNLNKTPNSISKEFKKAIRIEVKKFIVQIKEQPNYWNL